MPAYIAAQLLGGLLPDTDNPTSQTAPDLILRYAQDQWSAQPSWRTTCCELLPTGGCDSIPTRTHQTGLTSAR